MTLLSARGLSISLGGTSVLTDVDLDIAAGEVVGLLGPNGAGKTTLVKALAGLLPIDGGTIRLRGEPLQQTDRARLARLLAYLPQGGESHWPVTVETLVMLARLPHYGPWASPGAADRAAVQRALDACGVAALRNRPVTRLSGGERARVLLARALAGEPELLLADEPVGSLDPGHQLDVMARLRSIAAAGAAVAVVMHDLTLAARFCDRLVLLHGGRVAAHGRPGSVLSPDNLARCYGVRALYTHAEGGAVVVPLARA